MRPAPTPEEWDDLTDHPILTIAVGDFNAEHSLWNSNTTNVYGNSLLDNLETHVIGPEDPTYYPYKGR